MLCSTSSSVTPLLAQLGERLIDEVDELRGKSKRRLIHDKKSRLREQGARDRKLLLFAAG